MEMKAETKSIHNNNNYSSTSPPLNLFFYSNPSSPRFSSSLSPRNDDHDDDDKISLLSRDGFSSVPFSWELTPGIPKSADDNVEEFDFSGQLDMMLKPSLSSADELFDSGKIKPLLRPPPRLVLPPPTSPTLSKSPKQRSKPRFEIDDPFETALRKNYGNSNHQTQVRGRTAKTGTKHGNNGNGSGRKGLSRSLSPLRVSEFALLHHQQQQEEEDRRRSSSLSSSSTSKKWRLKDLFLFRSASEGTSRSLASKYSFLSRRNSMDSEGSVSKRRGQQQQANESDSTASEELKKRTSSPYKRSFLGCLLGFQPHSSTPL